MDMILCSTFSISLCYTRCTILKIRSLRLRFSTHYLNLQTLYWHCLTISRCNFFFQSFFFFCLGPLKKKTTHAGLTLKYVNQQHMRPQGVWRIRYQENRPSRCYFLLLIDTEILGWISLHRERLWMYKHLTERSNLLIAFLVAVWQ